MKILFIGFGNVAKEMGRIFIERDLYPALDFKPVVVGIFTGRHGGLEKKEGIELKEVLNELRLNNRLTADEKELSSLTPLEAAKTLDYDVLVELSALSIEGRGEPAASHISAALMRGKSVVCFCRKRALPRQRITRAPCSIPQEKPWKRSCLI